MLSKLYTNFITIDFTLRRRGRNGVNKTVYFDFKSNNNKQNIHYYDDEYIGVILNFPIDDRQMVSEIVIYQLCQIERYNDDPLFEIH